MNEAQSETRVIGGSTSAEPKHVALDRSIKSIQDVLNQVNSLKRRISGEETGPECGEPKNPNQPYLLEVLTAGSTIIDGTCSQIHKALSDLENSLF